MTYEAADTRRARINRANLAAAERARDPDPTTDEVRAVRAEARAAVDAARQRARTLGLLDETTQPL